MMDGNRMRMWWIAIVAGGLFSLGVIPVSAQQTIKKEIDIGFANIDSVRTVLKQVLSPQGKFVMLPGKGSIMLIDTPQNIMDAELALASADLPDPDVALDFQFKTGLPTRKTSITVAQEVPFPTAYQAPTILVGPNGPYAVIPATPTSFRTRNIGVTSETSSTLNPDGSITMDINTEHTEFEGFINYGSSIVPAGNLGNVPVINGVANPQFFNPFINSGDILMPIIGTTRISTSIIIRPRVSKGVVSLDMMPRLTVETNEPGADDLVVNLKDYRTTVDIRNNQVGRVRGFMGASEEFNRQFLGAKDPAKGETAIVIKAELREPAPETVPVPPVSTAEE